MDQNSEGARVSLLKHFFRCSCLTGALCGLALTLSLVACKQTSIDQTQVGIVPVEDRRVTELVGDLSDAHVEFNERKGDEAIARIKLLGADAVPGLLYLAVNESVSEVERYCATAAIYKLGVLGNGATGQLMRAFSREEAAFVRMALLRTARQVNGENDAWARPYIGQLVIALTDDFQVVADESALILGALGPDAKVAVPFLISLLENEDRALSSRRFAALALADIDPSSDEVMQALTRATLNEYLEDSAHEALKNIQVKAK